MSKYSLQRDGQRMRFFNDKVIIAFYINKIT